MLALAFHSATFTPISATPSLPVLGFAFALSLLTGVMFGVVPAWLASRSDPAEALHGAGRGTRGGQRCRRRYWWLARRRFPWFCLPARDY